MPENSHHVAIDDEGRLVAAADLQTDPGSGVSRAQLHVEAGHNRPGTGARLMDAVVDAVRASAVSERVMRLVAAIPAGEAEVLERFWERCDDVQTRAAGATVIAEGTLRDP